MVDSEEALLQILFTLGHPPLLHHIRWEFVSAAAIASLCEDTALYLRSGWWLPIVSEFQPLFEEFRAKRFNLLWRAAAAVSTPRNSTATGTAA
jgi:hypothetical protein